MRSGDQPHALAHVPGPVAEAAGGLIHLRGEERGQENPVVGGRRFAADHRHVEAGRRMLAEPLEEAQARHAVADDDEPLAHCAAHAASAGA